MAITRINTANATAGSISSLNALLSSGAVTAGNSLICHFCGGAFPTGSTSGSSVLTLNPTDNVNAGAWSTAAVSTQTDGFGLGFVGIYYRTGISSGAIASTYRVRFDNFSAAGFCSMNVYEYSGIASFDKAGTAGPTASSSPTSTSLTAASASALFSACASPFTASTMTARSTGSPTNMTVIVVDQNNANQELISGELITSSLTEQPIFRIATSTRWLATDAIFLASTAGGGATPMYVRTFTTLGVGRL